MTWPTFSFLRGSARVLAALAVLLSLTGCLLDGFGLGSSYQANEAGAVEPVANLRTYRVGGGTPDAPVVQLRFVRVGANQYVMEQFVQEGADVSFVAVQSTFVPLEGGWHMLFWRDRRFSKGVQLVRFGPNTMEIAEVSKLDAPIARIMASNGMKVSKSFGGTGLTLAGATPQQLPSALGAVVRLPGLRTIRLAATDSVPADIRNRAMPERAPQFAALDLQDLADPQQASRMLNYFRVLHGEGVGLGSYAYARFAYNGWGMPKDTRLARELATRAVALGVPMANNLLGVMALNGIDEPVDQVRSVRLFELAARAGEGGAFSNLGIAYLKGYGVTKDPALAAQWFERGIGVGNERAMVQMADMLLDGVGVANDDKRAAELLDRAIGASHPHAIALRAWMYAKGRGGPADQVKASQLFLNAAQLGSAFGQWQIGSRLMEGNGVAVDRDQGVKWLKQAADAGVAEAKLAYDQASQATIPQTKGEATPPLAPGAGITVVARLTDGPRMVRGTHWLIDSSVRRYANTLMFDVARAAKGESDDMFHFWRYWGHCASKRISLIAGATGFAKPGDVLFAYRNRSDHGMDVQKTLDIPTPFVNKDDPDAADSQVYRTQVLQRFCSMQLPASTQRQRVSISMGRQRSGGPEVDQLALESVVRQGSLVEGAIFTRPLAALPLKAGETEPDYEYKGASQTVRMLVANCTTRELATKERWTSDEKGTPSLLARNESPSAAAKGTVGGTWLDALCQM